MPKQKSLCIMHVVCACMSHVKECSFASTLVWVLSLRVVSLCFALNATRCKGNKADDKKKEKRWDDTSVLSSFIEGCLSFQHTTTSHPSNTQAPHLITHSFPSSLILSAILIQYHSLLSAFPAPHPLYLYNLTPHPRLFS